MKTKTKTNTNTSTFLPFLWDSRTIHLLCLTYLSPHSHKTQTTGAARQQGRMTKTCVVMGVNGALGQAIRATFLRASYRVLGIDTRESLRQVSIQQRIDKDFVPYKTGGDYATSAKEVIAHVSSLSPMVDTVICTAGGWRGGSITDANIFHNVDAMHDMNVRTALLATYIAANHLRTSGLLVLTGADAAMRPTPSMLAYGMSKASTHHLLASVASDNSLPDAAVAVGILPATLDTPTNRAVMPGADFLSWTPVSEVAEKILAWSEKKETPQTGDLYSIKTNQGITAWTKVE